MKPVSMWVIIGTSLFIATGALAQSHGNRPPALFADFGDFEVMTAATGMPIADKATPLPGTVPIAGINELLQSSLLRQSRLRSIGAQAQAEMPDTSNLNDLVPLVKGQGNVINKLGLTNDNDLIF
jgi:hypothetical protein